jgi:hypothetical protein
MTDRPSPAQSIYDHLVVSTIAHEAAADLYRELVELGGDDDYAHELVRESAAVATDRLPGLVRPLRDLESQWAVQELLDPPAAERTLERMVAGLAELAPELEALSDRQRRRSLRS